MYKVLLVGTVIPTPSSTFSGPYNTAFTFGDIVTLEAIVSGVANAPYMVNDPGSITSVLAAPCTANRIAPPGSGILILLLPLTTALLFPAIIPTS